MSKRHSGKNTHWAKFDSWMAKTDNYVEQQAKIRAMRKAERAGNKKSPRTRELRKYLPFLF